MTLHHLVERTAAEFEKAYGRPPTWIAAAPGRVNVIGEHTDYNDGFVLPMAIDRYTVVAAASSDQPAAIRLRSAASADPAVIDLNGPLEPAPRGTWYNYPLGVIAGFMARGVKPPGFDALIESTVPLGGGLSSSAALEVSTATVLERMTGHKLDPVGKALLCQQAEHQYAGMPCGIMDQFISVLGQADHLLLLDCRSRETQLVPMSDPAVSLLVANTNVKHELTGGEYAERRRQCETAAAVLGVKALRDTTLPHLQAASARMDAVVFRRARHVIGEIARTVEAARLVQQSRWPEVGELMYASHASLRDDYEVSCQELDAVVEIARGLGSAGGVIGCRMTGGGFGGCAVALVRTDSIDTVSSTIASEYERRTGIKATLFTSRPAAGACVLK